MTLNSRRLRFLAIGLSIAIAIVTAVLLVISTCTSVPTMSTQPVDYYDEISGARMSSPLLLPTNSYQLRVWHEGEAIQSSSMVTVVVDITSADGAQPLKLLALVAYDAIGRRWAAEIDLTKLGFMTYPADGGRMVVRYRVTDPFGERFSSDVCSERRNRVRIDVAVRTVDSEKTLALGQLELRAVSR
jgi:hypothetical protein